jgi:hypothetical protein
VLIRLSRSHCPHLCSLHQLGVAHKLLSVSLDFFLTGYPAVGESSTPVSTPPASGSFFSRPPSHWFSLTIRYRPTPRDGKKMEDDPDGQHDVDLFDESH